MYKFPPITKPHLGSQQASVPILYQAWQDLAQPCDLPSPTEVASGWFSNSHPVLFPPQADFCTYDGKESVIPWVSPARHYLFCHAFKGMICPLEDTPQPLLERSTSESWSLLPTASVKMLEANPLPQLSLQMTEVPANNCLQSQERPGPKTPS